VQVDEPGHDPRAAHVEHARRLRDTGGEPGAEAPDHAIFDQQIPLGIEVARGIDYPAASETQIHIAGTTE